jgi:hypothetical protein
MAEQWYYTRQGQRFGPLSQDQIRQLAQVGQLQQGDLVWTEGMAEWTPAGRFAQLFAPAAAAPVGMVPLPGPAPAMPMAAMQPAPAGASRGPFDALDLTFRRFAAPTIIAWLWGLYLLLMPVAFVLGTLWAVMTLRGGYVVGFVVVEPFVLALLTLLIRLRLERACVMFRIADTLHALREAQRSGGEK